MKLMSEFVPGDPGVIDPVPFNPVGATSALRCHPLLDKTG